MNTDTLHIRTDGMYWCGAEVASTEAIVTADGALFHLINNKEGVCKACLRAIVEFIGEHIDEIPDDRSVDPKNMTDNLARISLMRMAESIAVPFRDLSAELYKQLYSISWHSLHRECGRMELAIRDFRDVVKVCSIIYGPTNE